MDQHEASRARTRRQRYYRSQIGIVSMNPVDKKKAIRKLAMVYNIHRPRWTWDTLSEQVARALKVPLPDNVVNRAGMIHAFCREVGAPLPAGTDRVAMLRERHPFRPLQVSDEMRRQLERVREFVTLGRSFDGRMKR